VLDPGDVGLGHLQNLGKLGLRLADLLSQLSQANRRDDRALARVDLSGGAGALSDFLAELAGARVPRIDTLVKLAGALSIPLPSYETPIFHSWHGRSAFRPVKSFESEHFNPRHEGAWHDGIAQVVDRATGRVIA
jgi:hypothetical protein